MGRVCEDLEENEAGRYGLHKSEVSVSIYPEFATWTGLTQYKAPRKTIVGIANENAIFLYNGRSDPKAGAVIYCVPCFVLSSTHSKERQ